MSTISQRERKRRRAQHHTRHQAERKREALAEATAAAKQSKKGIEREMKKRGYIPNDNGGWRRLPKEER